MATLTINRSDLFPVGTTVSVRPFGARRDGQGPSGAELATGTVSADGSLSITDSDIVSGTRFTLYAQVGNEHRYADARSTLDVHDGGTFVATADTATDSPVLINMVVTSGTALVGSRVTGPGIPAGAVLIQTTPVYAMNVFARATASGVTLRGDGAYTWRAKLQRRRAAALGTS